MTKFNMERINTDPNPKCYHPIIAYRFLKGTKNLGGIFGSFSCKNVQYMRKLVVPATLKLKSPSHPNFAPRYQQPTKLILMDCETSHTVLIMLVKAAKISHKLGATQEVNATNATNAEKSEFTKSMSQRGIKFQTAFTTKPK